MGGFFPEGKRGGLSGVAKMTEGELSGRGIV